MIRRIPLILAVTIMATSLTGCDRGSDREPEAVEEESHLVPVAVERVETGDLATHIRVTSRLEAVRSVTVISEVSGKVEELHVKEGDSVGKGDVLVKVEDEELNYELNEAEAAYALAKANYEKLANLSRPQEIEAERAKTESTASELEKAELEFQRVSRLYQEGISPKEAYDAARAGYQSARAAHQAAKERFDLLLEGARKEDISAARSQMEQAKAKLSLAQKRLRDATIRSPISGRVSALPVVEGDRISIGSPVAHIVDLKLLKIQAGLTQEEVMYAKEGQAVTFTTEAFPGEHFSGIITYAGLESEEKTGLFPIKTEVRNDSERLRPGMMAEVKIPKESLTNALIIPRDAVVDRRYGTVAYVVEDGRAREREVELGISDGSRTVVRKGLQEGDILVIRGQEGLKEGDPVYVEGELSPQP